MSVPVFINSVSTVATASGSTIVGAPVAVGDNALPGDLLVLAVLWPDTGQGITSITDSKGNTWTRAKQQFGVTGPFNMTMEVWYCQPTTTLTSSDTVTVTLAAGATANKGMHISHFGSVSPSALDKTVSQFISAPASGSLTSGATAATTQAEELVFGAYGTYRSAGGGTFTPGAGSTAIGTVQWFTSNAIQIFVEYKTVTSTGVQATAATDSVTPGEYFGFAVTFKGLTAKIPGGLSVPTCGITPVRVFPKTSGAASIGTANIDERKVFSKQLGGVSIGTNSVSYTRQYRKNIGAASAGISSAGTHSAVLSKTSGGIAVGAPNVVKKATFNKGFGGVSASIGAIFRGSRAYVTYIDFVVLTQASYNYAEGLGGVSAGTSGIAKATVYVKSLGGVSVATANITKGTISQVKVVGGISTGTGSAGRQTLASKIVGGSSRPTSQITRRTTYPRASGSLSAASCGLGRATTASKVPGAVSGLTGAVTPAQIGAKVLGGVSSTTSAVAIAHGFGGRSGLTAGLLRMNRAVVTWVAFEIPMAVSTTFSKTVGGISVTTPGVGRFAVHSLGAGSSTGAGTSRSTGLSGPWPASPFTYTLNPNVLKSQGGVSPLVGGIGKLQIVSKVVGAASVGTNGIAKSTIISRGVGGLSTGAPNINKQVFITTAKTYGAISVGASSIIRSKVTHTKTPGGVSVGASGVAKGATFNKTFGAISITTANIGKFVSSALSKVVGSISVGTPSVNRTTTTTKKTFGAISAASGSVTPFAQSVVKTYGAISSATGSVTPRVLVTVVGGKSFATAGITKVIKLGKILGATSASTGSVSRVTIISRGYGATSTATASVGRVYFYRRSVGAISQATANIDEFHVVLGFGKLSGATSVTACGVIHASFFNKAYGAASVGRANISYFQTGQLRKLIGSHSTATSGITARILFAILPGTDIDYLLLSAEIEAGPEYGGRETVLLSAEVYE